MTPSELYHEAIRRGLRLEARGDKLVVSPAKRVPREFANVLRLRKRELLVWLEAKSTNLTPDCVPWLHLARQILDGRFDGAEDSTRKSICIGLRSITNPSCKRALQRLTIQLNR